MNSEFCNYLLVEPLIQTGTVDIQRRIIDVQTICLIRANRTQNIDIGRGDIITHCLTRASKRSNLRRILRTCLPTEGFEDDIGDGQRGRILQTQRQITLSIALIYFDGVVNVVNDHRIVGDVVDHTSATASLEIT